jgi:hypothetical protein
MAGATPQGPPGPQTGRFGQADPTQGPEQAAMAAALDARANGGDAHQAAKHAWTTEMIRLNFKLMDPNYQPTDPGEANLQKIQHFLITKGTEPLQALLHAHRAIGQLSNGQGGQPQQPAPGGR